jgi:hypothetical protein
MPMLNEQAFFCFVDTGTPAESERMQRKSQTSLKQPIFKK